MQGFKKFLRILVWLAVLAGVLLLILHFSQNVVVYPGHSMLGGNTDWNARLVTTSNRGFPNAEIPDSQPGKTIRVIFAASNQGVVPAVLWFHGRDEDITKVTDVIGKFRELGNHVLAMEYPGYGDSRDSLSEKHVLARAEAAFDYLAKREDVAPQRVWVCGYELGANVALHVATKRPAAGVIAFATLPDMETAVSDSLGGLKVGFLLRDHYVLEPILSAISCPVLFVHGSGDALVPPERIDEFAMKPVRRSRVMRVEGAAGTDLVKKISPDQWQAIGAFIQSGGR